VAARLTVEVGHPSPEGRPGYNGDEGFARNGERRAKVRAQAEPKAADGETRREKETERLGLRGAQELDLARAARRAVFPDGGEESPAGSAAAGPSRHVEVEDDEDVPPNGPCCETEKRAGAVGRREEAVGIGREGVAQVRRPEGNVLLLRGPDRNGYSRCRHLTRA